MNIRKHKKKLAAVLVLGVAAAISIPLLMPQKPAEDTVREREYTATRDTITVGVESSGLVDTGPNAHTFEAGTVVEDLLVKVGSEVKKGDPLASISTENLKELIGTAQDELSNAKAALLQASSSKDILIAQNNKDKQDGLDGVQQEYANQIELLTSEKTRIESSIAQQEAILAQLQQQIADDSAQVGNLEEKVEELKAKINQNILEIGRLNEELLKVDDGSDERNTLNNRIVNLQYDIQKFNGQLSEKASLAANNASQIQSLEAEIQNLKEQLAGLDTSAPENEQKIQELQQQIADNQQKIRQFSYTDEIDALNSQIAGKESQLRNAQRELNFLSDGSEERNAIQLEITKLQNENTAMQQEIDAYVAATSSTVPTLFTGIFFIFCSIMSSGTCSIIPVLITPGATAFTLIPYFPSSRPRQRVKLISAAFDAE